MDEIGNGSTLRLPRIDRRVSWGQIGSTIVVLISGGLAVIAFTWTVSAQYTSLMSETAETHRSIETLQTDVSAIKKNQGDAERDRTDFQLRLAGIEKYMSDAPARRSEFTAQMLGKLQPQLDEQGRKLAAMQEQLDQATKLITEMQAKQTAMYKDFAGFKCKIAPRTCSPQPMPESQ